jgi:hypothetical protein
MARRPPFARARMLVAVAAAAVAVLAVSAASLAAPSAPPGSARDLALSYFTGNFVRAEVVTFTGRVEHDYRLDEGRVMAVRPTSIDLLERDGTRQTIPISGQTLIAGVGRLFSPGSVVRGTRVVALRDGSGAAQQIRPSNWTRVAGRTLMGGALVRAEVLNYQGKTLHDYRIDQGRVVGVKPASITLAERDGSRQTIAVTATTLYTVGGQAVDQSSVTKGQTAITIREGDGPAEQVLLAATPFLVHR